jgi:hypothetical protein
MGMVSLTIVITVLLFLILIRLISMATGVVMRVMIGIVMVC